MVKRTANVFCVPADQSFLDVLATAILNGDLPVPGGRAPDLLALTDITVILPTRRSAKALTESFLKIGGGRAILLPAIRPIGVDDADQRFVQTLLAGDAHAFAEIPAAISPLERQLALAGLVRRWSDARGDESGSIARALGLAKELAQLMDLVETEQRSLEQLARLVPDRHSEHWRQTLAFLEIITTHWPSYLGERGLTSPADRRNRLIQAQAERLSAAPPVGPVIVAGVTGSVPSTGALMAAVAALPQGAVVLPGLDQDLDAVGWEAIASRDHTGPSHPEHPQFGLRRLLEALGVAREDVRELPRSKSKVELRARARLVTEAMRPASTTDAWHTFAGNASGRADLVRGLEGVTLLEAPSAQDEAEAIALILREAMETPGRTAALMSPDRNLGRRVTIALQRWGIAVDDSAGRPLRKTPPGILLDHIVTCVESDFEPQPLLALLKHPLTRLGWDAVSVRRAARSLELLAFRQPYFGSGLTGIRRAVDRAEAAAAADAIRHRAIRRVRSADFATVRDLLDRLERAFEPLSLPAWRDMAGLAELAAAHIAVARAVASDDSASDHLLWLGENGDAAADFFERLQQAPPGLMPLTIADYPEVYRSLAGSEVVRPTIARHPRLFIWGPYESRLMQPDLVVLGGLNEGTWPEVADPGPWLNRGMLRDLGLPAPEERIGFAAHDFTQLVMAPEVVLTRATKVDGNPTVPSRWLLRLQALLAGLGMSEAILPSSERPWLAWAFRRNEVPKAPAAAPPRPCPPVEARPRRLSATDVETWIANPYAIYAKRILGLEPLRAAGAEPGGDMRGTLVHQALHEFVRSHPGALPSDSAARLMGILDRLLAEHAAHPRIAAFWRPRFARFAAWFAETEPERRRDVVRIVSEVTGKRFIEAPAGPFELTARADRIDVGERGLIITDYKTGSIPTGKEVTSNVKPQLPLEAAIALDGGFVGIAERRVAGLRFIRASGGEPPGAALDVNCDGAEAGRAALDGLHRLIGRFDDPSTPYHAARRAQFKYDYDHFAHLARIDEWSVGGGGDDVDEA